MATAQIAGLRIRKLADTSTGTRIDRFDPVTGARKLVDPSTPGEDHEPWPLAGVRIEGDTPKSARLSTGLVQNGMHEGWITLEGSEPVHRPGGPPSNPWRVTHTFLHAEAIVIDTVDGPVRYRVVRQPDKYAVKDYKNGSYDELVPVVDDKAEVTDEVYANGDTDISWFYDVKLEEA